jgi:hypothetical protein
LKQASDNEDAVGRYFLGIIDTIMPLHAGKIDPPKNKTNHRKTTTTKISSKKVIGIIYY